MTKKDYQKGYQAGQKNGYYDGWKAALDAIRKPNGRMFYCLKCGKPLNPGNRGGLHRQCGG